MWKIKNKEAVSPVIGVILMVAITVVLAAVLYVWVSGFMGGAGGGSVTLAMTNAGTSGNNITWSVVSTSSGGIKIADITWQITSTVGTVIGSGVCTATGIANGNFTWTDSAPADSRLSAGDTVVSDTGGSGDFYVIAIYGGSQVWKSGVTHVA